jgi:sterol 3beta-glucosyltransferase
MKITVLTAGSRGDTQPYIALGLALQKAGHAVRVATFNNFKTLVECNGLDFFPVRGDVVQVSRSELGREAMSPDNPLKVLLSFNQLKRLVGDLQQDFYDACTGADAIIYHPGAAIGFFIAQEKKIPAILATPYAFTPTSDYPSLLFYHLPRLGKPYNTLTHRIQAQIFWSTASQAIGDFWKSQFGRPPDHFGSPFSKQITRRDPTVISYSEHVFPRPTGWPEAVHITGYWFLEEEAGWQPPQDLVDFLQAGKPPVYVGFGSVGDASVAEQKTHLVIEALKQSGQRGVLATGWNALTKIDNLPETIHMLDSAPHSWLFPRMAAVVHHGGAGTTAAGFRAGIPSVILPYGNDQFAWGLRAFELGVGARPVSQKRLTVEALSGAIAAALKLPVVEAARGLGEKIRRERGAENAAEIIGRCWE